jgi:hypothetical protein
MTVVPRHEVCPHPSLQLHEFIDAMKRGLEAVWLHLDEEFGSDISGI